MSSPRSLMIGLWAALLLILGVLTYSALSACALGVPGMPAFLERCGSVATATPTRLLDAQREGEHLRSALRALEQDLGRAEMCAIERVAVPSEDEPTPQDEALWTDQEVGMLEGCWNLATDTQVIHHDNTDDVADVPDWTICFDDQGRGTHQLSLDRGAECSGTAQAGFLDDGRLEITDDEDLFCSDDTFIFRAINVCEYLENGRARCRGRQPDAGTTDIITYFER